MICSPRIFAESFYNSKDVVFLACCAIATHTLIQFLQRPSLGRVIIHGIISAIAIDIRIAAVIFPLLTCFMVLGYFIYRNIPWRKLIWILTIYALTTIFIVYILWPWLWSQPIDNFFLAFKNMSKFRWDNFNLYFGNYIKATNLPWHYSPVWISLPHHYYIVYYSLSLSFNFHLKQSSLSLIFLMILIFHKISYIFDS